MVHGNGERASTTSPWRDSSDTNERLDQWLRWPGRVAEVAQVGAAGHVQPAPQRLARHRDEQPALRRRAPSRRRCARGRARARGPRSRVAMSNSPSANGRFSAFITRYSRFGAWRFSHSAWSAGSSRSMPTTRRSPRRRAHFSTSTPSPQPTSRIDCGAACDEQLVERALEAGHQAAHDRVRRPVLVVRVAGDRALAVDGDGRAAHTLEGLPFIGLLAVGLGRRLAAAAAPVVAGCSVGAAPGS